MNTPAHDSRDVILTLTASDIAQWKAERDELARQLAIVDQRLEAVSVLLLKMRERSCSVRRSIAKSILSCRTLVRQALRRLTTA
jgi:hypothetical protein